MISFPGPTSALVTLPVEPDSQGLARVLELERLVLETVPVVSDTIPAFNRLLIEGEAASWDPEQIERSVGTLVSQALARRAYRPGTPMSSRCRSVTRPSSPRTWSPSLGPVPSSSLTCPGSMRIGTTRSSRPGLPRGSHTWGTPMSGWWYRGERRLVPASRRVMWASPTAGPACTRLRGRAAGI